MPIKTACPNCDAPYTLADTMEGKKVRCKTCSEPFTVSANGAATNGAAPKAKRKADSEELVQARPNRPAPARDDDEEDDRPRKKSRPDRDEDEDDRPARGRDRDDEDDDRPARSKKRDSDVDDDRPRRGRADDDDRPRRKGKKAGSNAKMWIIIGSAAGVLLIVGIIVVALAMSKPADPMDQFAREMEALKKDMPQNMFKDLAKEMAKDNPFKDLAKEIQAKDNPFKDLAKENPFVEKKQKLLTLPEYLQNLKTGDDRDKTNAVNFFNKTDPNIPERAQVAKAAEALVGTTKYLGDVNKLFYTWATKDQAPKLIEMVKKNTGPGANGQAMMTLARLKDDAGIDAIAVHLADFFARESAQKALKEYGKDGEAGLIRNMFHKNGEARNIIAKLQTEIATPTDKMYPQAIKDLASADKESRNAAANWLAKNEVKENYRADATKGLGDMAKEKETWTAALKAMETWATKDNVPGLIELMGKQDSPRSAILRVLGKLKDERAAEAIAGRLPERDDRKAAGLALRDIGAPAEKAVLAYLNHADTDTHNEARKILNDLKTKNETLLEQTIKDMTDAENKKRRPALGYLATLPVDEMQRGKVTKALDPLMKDAAKEVSEPAYKAFWVWAGQESLPILIQLITQDQSSHRHKAMDVAAKFKDQTAAGAITSRLTHAGDKDHSTKVLKTMGAIAQGPVAQLMLNSKDNMRIHCLHILREIGTRQTLPAVQQVMKIDKNKSVLKAALEAGQAMQGR